MKLFIFDVDGTLVDSQHHIHGAMTHAFEAVGLPPLPLSQVLQIVGLSLPVAIARLVPEAVALLPAVKDCADDFGVADAGLFGAAIPILGVAGDQHAAQRSRTTRNTQFTRQHAFGVQTAIDAGAHGLPDVTEVGVDLLLAVQRQFVLHHHAGQ